MNAEDLSSAFVVGHANDDLAVEATWAAERLVDRFRPVGGRDDDEVLARLKPVHQAQQLGDDALFRFAGDLATLGRDGIDLVDEDDRGRGCSRLFEQFAQTLLALAIGRAHDFRAGDVEELRVAFVGHSAGEARLAGAGRSVQQNALGRIDTEALK